MLVLVFFQGDDLAGLAEAGLFLGDLPTGTGNVALCWPLGVTSSSDDESGFFFFSDLSVFLAVCLVCAILTKSNLIFKTLFNHLYASSRFTNPRLRILSSSYFANSS